MNKYLTIHREDGDAIMENLYWRERKEKVEAVAGGLIILALIILGITLI